LALRVGINGYNNHTEEEWLRDFTKTTVDNFNAFKEKGVARFPKPEHAVAFAKQILDPDNHKFGTPSSKIEIYSTTMAENPDPFGLGAMPPIPTWLPQIDVDTDPDAKFPLALCSSKSRARTHSIHGNQEKLGRVDPDDIWINSDDAAARGIEHGQKVRVFNSRGATLLPANVTNDIAPGVVSIKEGAWYTPGEDGDDTEGCANTLSADRSSPGGATTYNTNFVDVALV